MIAAFLLAAACGKNQAVKEVEGLADEMCACKDIKCAAEVTRKATEVMKKYAHESAGESTVKAIEAAGERMRQCTQKIGK
jgi:hypothetical protein